MGRRKIPGKSEWAGYETDPEVRYARKLLFGKSTSEVVEYFADGRCIMRADELLHMPRKAFQYYIFGFMEYICSSEAEGDSDGASVFLSLLFNREEKDPGSVQEIYAGPREGIEFVSSRQEYFDAPPDIYGSFVELGQKVHRLCMLER